MGSLSRRTSKSSDAAIKVPIPGDVTFISYKTSLQDYCQKVGWLAPVYSTTQFDDGFHSKVTFGGSTFDSGSEFGVSRQEAEQRAAHIALIGLGCLDTNKQFGNDGKFIITTSFPDPNFWVIFRFSNK
jgi:dsRNA-specific ribonuclease